MTANHVNEKQESSANFLLRALTLASALTVLLISVLLFAPSGQAEPARAKGVTHSATLPASDRDNSQLEAFSKQEPYRADYSITTGK